MRIQSKLKKATETLEFFTCHQWEFTNDNIFMLLNQMNEVDAKVLFFYSKINLNFNIFKFHLRFLILMSESCTGHHILNNIV